MVEVMHTFRDTQRAFLCDWARCLMGDLGEYKMREKYRTAEDVAKGSELIAKVAGPNLVEIEKRVKLMTAREDERLLPRVQGRGLYDINLAPALYESLEEVEENDLQPTSNVVGGRELGMPGGGLDSQAKGLGEELEDFSTQGKQISRSYATAV